MRKMNKFETPVLFDANILIDFKGQLDKLFIYFGNILIHEKVYHEVLDRSIKEELDAISKEISIKYVTDINYSDDDSKALFKKCDEELKETFDIDNNRDLGEYKTLLYAKFNKVCLISTQDTTVWRLLLDSENFRGMQCMTVQDLAYYLYLNSNNKSAAKRFYKHYSRVEHAFIYFKKYMEQCNNEIPKYVEFEYDRICNFKELVAEYFKCYEGSYNLQQIEDEISRFASNDNDTCLSCLISRVDKNAIDFNRRRCLCNYTLNDENCKYNRKEFKMKIRNMER